MLDLFPNELLSNIVNNLGNSDKRNLNIVLNKYWITEKEDRFRHKFYMKFVCSDIEHYEMIMNCQDYDCCNMRTIFYPEMKFMDDIIIDLHYNVHVVDHYKKYNHYYIKFSYTSIVNNLKTRRNRT